MRFPFDRMSYSDTLSELEGLAIAREAEEEARHLRESLLAATATIRTLAGMVAAASDDEKKPAPGGPCG